MPSNNLGDKGAIKVAHLIRPLKKFECLSLGNNNISDEGIGFITDAIIKMKSVKFLDLSNIHYIYRGKLCRISWFTKDCRAHRTL